MSISFIPQIPLEILICINCDTILTLDRFIIVNDNILYRYVLKSDKNDEK